MPPVLLIGIIALGWIALITLIRVVIVPWLERSTPGNTAGDGLLWHAARLYSRLLHRARFHRHRQLRHRTNPGGLIVVSNHTSALDPVLIQSSCRFHIRWLMASDMMIDELDWLWQRQNIIPVARDGRDSAALREAVKHVRNGGVIGMFPEGRIVTRGEIRPFFTGVGLIAARTGAPVLLVWISGTPETDTLASVFVTPSRSRVEFIDLLQFEKDEDAKAITQRLRERIAEASGWPLNDQPMTPEEEREHSVYQHDNSNSSRDTFASLV